MKTKKILLSLFMLTLFGIMIALTKTPVVDAFIDNGVKCISANPCEKYYNTTTDKKGVPESCCTLFDPETTGCKKID